MYPSAITRRTSTELGGGKLLPATSYYSSDYFSARRRFVTAAKKRGFELHALPIEAPSPTPEPLTIDVAFAGAERPTSAVVVSSGVHGVEGFFGSAVQLAFLDRLSPAWRPPDGAAIVFLHALNPFGFAWRRRFNEVNIDVNRNFLLPNEKYSGSPPLCGAFRNMMLKAGGSRFDLAAARMALLAWRHGLRSFWETLPVGQYDFPDWLFFGGHGRSQSALALDEWLPKVLGDAANAVHLDFHTGLGRWTDCQLLLSESDNSENAGWWTSHYGAGIVKARTGQVGTYQARGSLGPWLRSRLPRCNYHFATAEFGTYSPARVIQELVRELGWHARLGTQSAEHWSRRRLADTFVPRSRRWRTSALERGFSLIQCAADSLWPSAP